MKIKEVEFIKTVSIHNDKVFLDARKEIVFIGRSNVGKSSLMNRLFHKKDMVKTSSKPGKTRTANIFLINGKYHYTDLPGYGFAKLGQALREDLDALISWYLEEKIQTIRQVILICDAKIGPQQSDRDMYEYVQKLGLPISIVLAKIDRLGRQDISASIEHTKKIFFGARIFALSASSGDGVKELEQTLGDILTSK